MRKRNAKALRGLGLDAKFGFQDVWVIASSPVHHKCISRFVIGFKACHVLGVETNSFSSLGSKSAICHSLPQRIRLCRPSLCLGLAVERTYRQVGPWLKGQRLRVKSFHPPAKSPPALPFKTGSVHEVHFSRANEGRCFFCKTGVVITRKRDMLYQQGSWETNILESGAELCCLYCYKDSRSNWFHELHAVVCRVRVSLKPGCPTRRSSPRRMRATGELQSQQNSWLNQSHWGHWWYLNPDIPDHCCNSRDDNKLWLPSLFGCGWFGFESSWPSCTWRGTSQSLWTFVSGPEGQSTSKQTRRYEVGFLLKHFLYCLWRPDLLRCLLWRSLR